MESQLQSIHGDTDKTIYKVKMVRSTSQLL